jgi:hypothetical protein
VSHDRCPTHDERVVRLVPISADQVRVLESLERAFFGLASDFHRDIGGEESIAGGLFRLWSTLDVIATFWKEEAQDPATVERWREALVALASEAPIDDVPAFAREALAG